MQRVQNVCAKLTLRKGRYDSPTECLRQLHWLPVRFWINFKILVLIRKCIYKHGPKYLRDLVVPLQPSRPCLRSEKNDRLLMPKTTCETFAARSFSIAAPTLWNSMPEEIKQITNLLSFKKALKTHLFRIAFNL